VRRRKASAPAARYAGGGRRGDLLGRRIGPDAISKRGLNQHRVTIYDGRDAVGTVALTDGAFVAVTGTGEVVGSFDTLVAAARSLPAGGRDG